MVIGKSGNGIVIAVHQIDEPWLALQGMFMLYRLVGIGCCIFKVEQKQICG
jgi:hypothetical protein